MAGTAVAANFVMWKEILQGKWLGHPLHPALVHVPTGLLPAALIFDLFSKAGVGGSTLVRTSFYCVLIGLIGGLIAAPTGLVDWLDIKPDKPAYKIALWHMGLNVLAIVVWAVNLGVRWSATGWPTRIETAPLELSIVGTIILAVSGYLGSRMVFDQGTGVARFSKKKWRKLALESGANVPEQS